METRAHIWAGWFVWGLLGCTAALAVAGIAARFLQLHADDAAALENLCVAALAGVAAFSLAVANSAATAISALAGKGKPWALRLAVIVAVVTGLVSLAGVHLAWAVLTGQPDALPGWSEVHAAGFALAFVKPAQSFVIGAWSEAARADALARTEAEEAARLDLAKLREQHLHEQAMARIGAQRAAEPAPEPPRAAIPAPPKPSAARKSLKLVEKAAMGAMAAGALIAAPAHASGEPAREPGKATEQRQAAGPSSADRALARSLIAQGVLPGVVSKRTGVPGGTCRRMACEFRAGRWAA